MNRIVLIGNGFDLAHGLKTSYADFLDWYWKKKIPELKDEYTATLDDGLSKFKSKYQSWITFWMENSLDNWKSEQEILKTLRAHKELVSITCSPFFELIQDQYEKKGWVDIENEYYRLLTLKSLPAGALNTELDVIKKKLIEYLSEVQNRNDIALVDDIKGKIVEPFKKEDIAVNSYDTFKEIIEGRLQYEENKLNELIGCYKDFRRYYPSHVIDFKERGGTIKDLETDIEFPKELFLPDRTLLLNFNYTNIADRYFPEIYSYRFLVNHIHGSLDSVDSVIFGYGDEQDESFKELQKRNDNESLNNIKSIRYLEAPNYKNLLSFMESAPYQIYIMGHSCGKSDGTLLNTLFEHKNCISIKPYYYQKEDGTNNYMEIVQNISRNFTDMKLMRDRVVNKTQCEALPQIKRK